MRKILYLLFPVLLFSCNKESLAENNATSAITHFYGGTVESTSNEQAKNITLKISGSNLLEKDFNYSDYHAGNIAWLFYHNLNEEKNKFSQITVDESLQNKVPKIYKFSSEELKEIDKLSRQVEITNGFLIKNNTAAITAQFDTDYQITQNELDDLLEEVYGMYGIINQVQFQGFKFAVDEDLGEIIDIKETMIMEKNNIALFLTYDRKSKKLVSFYIP